MRAFWIVCDILIVILSINVICSPMLNQYLIGGTSSGDLLWHIGSIAMLLWAWTCLWIEFRARKEGENK